MTRLASRFGKANIIRRDRPLTREELMSYVPSVFSEKSMNPAVSVTHTSQPLPCSTVYSVKDLSLS